jgi:hypothetical protein
MEKVTGIGGFFFLSKDSAALNEWYERHLGVRNVGQEYEDGSWWQDEGPTVFGAETGEAQVGGRVASGESISESGIWIRWSLSLGQAGLRSRLKRRSIRMGGSRIFMIRRATALSFGNRPERIWRGRPTNDAFAEANSAWLSSTRLIKPLKGLKVLHSAAGGRGAIAGQRMTAASGAVRVR